MKEVINADLSCLLLCFGLCLRICIFMREVESLYGLNAAFWMENVKLFKFAPYNKNNIIVAS